MFNDTFAGTKPTSVPMFIVFQILDAGLGAGLALFLYPDARTAADAVVVPHTQQPAANGGSRNHTAPAAETTDEMSTADNLDHVADEGRRPQMLSVCVHNAGRSQVAAALLEYHTAGHVDVRSAGSAPADEINPAVRAAMAESKSSRQRPPQTAHHRRRPHLRRALTRLVARRGQQRILRRTRQLLSWALARSPGPRCAA